LHAKRQEATEPVSALPTFAFLDGFEQKQFFFQIDPCTFQKFVSQLKNWHKKTNLV